MTNTYEVGDRVKIEVDNLPYAGTIITYDDLDYRVSVDGLGKVDRFEQSNLVLLPTGGGDVQMLTQEQWEALTTAQKQSYGLVAVQDADIGYKRGALYYGASYADFNVVQSGFGGASSASVTLGATGDFYLMVIAMNSEASTYNLTIGATLNGSALTGKSIGYNQYYSSGNDRRNYRVMLFPISGTSGDTIAITLTDKSNYSSFVYAVLTSPYLDSA